MKWTKISAIIGTTLLFTALTLKLAGYGPEHTSETITDPNDDTILIFDSDANDISSFYSTMTEPNITLFCYIDSSGKKIFEFYWEDLSDCSDDEIIRLSASLSLAKLHCWNHPKEQKALEEIVLRMIPERFMKSEKEENK